MYYRKKTEWVFEKEDFKPADIGFQYNPEISVLGVIHELLNCIKTAIACPLEEVVGGIMMDGFSYFQLLEELRGAQTDDAIARIDTVLGYPIFLMVMPGVAVCLKTTIAPELFRQQMAAEKEQVERVVSHVRGMTQKMQPDNTLVEKKTVH